MSGICAVWRKGSPERIAGLAATIAGGLSLYPEEGLRQETDMEAAVGVSARFAAQQIYRSGRLLLVCDAELLNETELAAEAGLSTVEPRTIAAVLAALYERQGPGFVKRLRGAFSLLLWDRKERQLLAAIDGFGIKRLAWHRDQRGVMIASRVDALARSGAIDLQINPGSIANVLNFTSNLAPMTIFSKIERLEPGTLLIASERDFRRENYWDMRYGVESGWGQGRLSSELESVVERSVAAHCQGYTSDNIGAYLSGGTDSSTVLGMMTRAAGGPVKSFSIGFQEHRFNELQYAEIAAQRFHSQHHTYIVDAHDCFDAIPKMIRAFDEPYGNSSAIPTYFCGRLAAREGVQVLLAGDGGDELFGGNERYATDKVFEIYHKVPRIVRRGLIEPALSALPANIGLLRRARGYVRRANIPGVERMFSFQFLRSRPLADIFEGDFLASLGDYMVLDIPAGHYSRAAAKDHLDRLLYVDVKITLADNDLPKVTCMSEAAGIKTRFPFLDREVAEFSGRIPARLKVKGFEKRYLFKRAFRNLLPIEIIKKKKHGFGIPVATWVNSDKRMREFSRDMLLSTRSFERGYFRRGFIEDLFHRNEASEDPYYGDIAWTLLALELWHREVVDAPIRVTV